MTTTDTGGTRSSFTRSYGKVLIKFITISIVSVSIGPAISFLLFLLFRGFILAQNLILNPITDLETVGYYAILMSILLFGITWYYFLVSEKKYKAFEPIDASLTLHEITPYLSDKQGRLSASDLPEQAFNSSEKNKYIIEQAFSLIGLLFIFALIFSMIALNIYLFGALIPLDNVRIFGSQARWYLGIFFYALLAVICLIFLLFKFKSAIFNRYIDQFNYKQFWYGFWGTLFLEAYKAENITNKIIEKEKVEKFKEKHPVITKKLLLSDTTTADDLLSAKKLFREKIKEAEEIPSFIIPKSVYKLIEFYAYATVIAGLLANKIIGAITTIFEQLAHILLGW
jgi:hypothetical protein